jgi:hypothetical protein
MDGEPGGIHPAALCTVLHHIAQFALQLVNELFDFEGPIGRVARRGWWNGLVTPGPRKFGGKLSEFGAVGFAFRHRQRPSHQPCRPAVPVLRTFDRSQA